MQRKPIMDVIHSWQMTRGTTRFCEIVEEKEYWDSTRMLTEEETNALEEASEEGETN